MTHPDYERMRLLADEVGRGNIYRDRTGFYNFQMLEGLLRKHGLMTPEYQRTFSTLGRQVGIRTRAESLDSLLTRIGEPTIAERLVDEIPQPSYEKVEDWYRLGELVKKRLGGVPIKLSNGWQIKYRTNIQCLQVVKDDGNTFISVLGPGNNVDGRHSPTFELFMLDGSDAFHRSYAAYSEVVQAARQEFFVEFPTESEIERAITQLASTH